MAMSYIKKNLSTILLLIVFFIGLSFLSTVTPAQLPTFSFFPVRALYIVVLPLLGLPVNAILI